MIEGARSRSIPLTNGSGSRSGRPKNLWIRFRNTGLFTLSPIENGSKFLSSSLLASLHALIFSSGKVTSSHWAVFFWSDGTCSRTWQTFGWEDRAKNSQIVNIYSCLLPVLYLLIILCSNCLTDSGRGGWWRGSHCETFPQASYQGTRVHGSALFFKAGSGSAQKVKFQKL
jgi:hypothetical protein